VALHWLVRRFFCSRADCTRTIFAEQLPKLAAHRARTSLAFDASLVDLGLECGGEAGRRLGKAQGIPTSGDTILRRLRALSLEGQPQPQHVGVDDFAFRKGQRYGTVIVDHDTGRVADLLPERSSESTAAWLAAHETVVVVTRDRSTLYAGGIDAGLPEAVQVADRFHLHMNLRESLVKTLERHRGEVTAAAIAASAAPPALASEPVAATAPPGLPPIEAAAASPAVPTPPAVRIAPAVVRPQHVSKAAQLAAASRERRFKRYEQVVALAAQDTSIRKIVQEVGISRATVRTFLAAGGFPEKSPKCTAGRSQTNQPIHRFAGSLREMWDAGVHNASELLRKIKAAGFTGSDHMVRQYIEPWRQGSVATEPVVKIHSKRLFWLLFKDNIVRTPQEQKIIEQLRGSCPEIRVGADLAREFGSILQEGTAEGMLGWIGRAQTSAVAELKSFADGLVRDWPSVKAAVELPWSNGRAEGHVNRIKLIKRKMYGRAKFDLLRIRVMARGP